MNEFIIYLGISIAALLLFLFWFARQGRVSEKKWLINQLNSAKKDQQEQYISALNALNQQANKTGMTTLLVALLIIPASFAIDYLWFQTIPLDQRVSMGNTDEAPDLATAVKQLEQKLADEPNDLQGQMLYGRTMMSMQNYPKAVAAYQKANELEPNHPNILTELAEAIAFQNNTGSFLGEPERYLSLAIEADPKHQKAMWLQGIVYYEKQQFKEAELIWTELLTLVDNPGIISTIYKQINQARAAMNLPPISPETKNESLATLYQLTIDASEQVKSLPLEASSRLFVFAKEINGPPMPIAAIPVSAPFDWPLTVNINDNSSLNPQRKLSQFEQVEWSAKLSLSGVATPDNSDINSETIVSQSQDQNIKLTLTQ